MRSELELDIRYYETDQMGVVHHSNYIRFFECGRMDLLRKVGLPMEELERQGVMSPIISVDAHYKLPARLGDRIRIVSIIDSVPMAKMTVKCEIYNQRGDLLCIGSAGLGFIDAQTRRPVRCPEALVTIIEKNIDKDL